MVTEVNKVAMSMEVAVAPVGSLPAIVHVELANLVCADHSVEVAVHSLEVGHRILATVMAVMAVELEHIMKEVAAVDFLEAAAVCTLTVVVEEEDRS